MTVHSVQRLVRQVRTERSREAAHIVDVLPFQKFEKTETAVSAVHGENRRMLQEILPVEYRVGVPAFGTLADRVDLQIQERLVEHVHHRGDEKLIESLGRTSRLP